MPTAPQPAPATREERAAQTREAVLNAAIEVFAEHGCEGATIRNIAERSGMKQPLIVYHFGSKEGLWQAAVELVPVARWSGATR